MSSLSFASKLFSIPHSEAGWTSTVVLAPAQVCTLQVFSLVLESGGVGGTGSLTLSGLQPLPRSCLFIHAKVTQEYSWVPRYKVLGHFYSAMDVPLLKKKEGSGEETGTT